MAQNMSGALRRNTKKGSVMHPDYKGDIMIDGVEYWLSGWVRKNEDGTQWLSLAAKAKEPKPEAPSFPDAGTDFPF